MLFHYNYTRCLRYNVCSAWFLDIRISTCLLCYIFKASSKVELCRNANLKIAKLVEHAQGKRYYKFYWNIARYGWDIGKTIMLNSFKCRMQAEARECNESTEEEKMTSCLINLLVKKIYFEEWWRIYVLGVDQDKVCTTDSP